MTTAHPTGTSPEVPTGGVSERLVAAITAAWQAIQAVHPDVPDVVVVLGSGTSGRRAGSTRLGHFAEARWQRLDQTGGPTGTAGTPAPTGRAGWTHELFIGGEGLRLGARALLATLLHEAAHGLATTRLIADTSRGGRFHNQRFRALALEVGLVVTEEGSRGWSHTELAAGTAERYTEMVARLAAVLTVSRREERPPRPAGVATSRNLLAVCGCVPPRRIRVARATLELAPITCGLCGEVFRPADSAGQAAGTGEAGVSLGERERPALS